MDNSKLLIKQALANKAASRHKARGLAWPEKIRVIERLRHATDLARRSMWIRQGKAAR